jgi:uncharacterized protein (TIGR00369 family)
MMNDLEAKTPAQSRMRLSMMMNPEHANASGNVHGGVIMKLVDEAGALAAMRHARAVVVTVAIDSMTFVEPVYVGHLVTVDAEVTWVGRTSIETRIQVWAEHPLNGIVVMTNHAYVVYVALDASGRPQPVPPLTATTPEEQARMTAGVERQAYRKAQRVKEQIAIAAENEAPPTS